MPTEMQQEALARARGSLSTSNYAAIFEGFAAMGIPEDDIKPRENVLTYHAWRALGRQVRKGEHGVRVITYIECKGKKNAAATDEPKASQAAASASMSTADRERAKLNRTNGIKVKGKTNGGGGRRPKSTTVFHISQTDPIEKKNPVAA